MTDPYGVTRDFVNSRLEMKLQTLDTDDIVGGLESHLNDCFWIFAPTFWWEVVGTFKWYFPLI